VTAASKSNPNPARRAGTEERETSLNDGPLHDQPGEPGEHPVLDELLTELVTVGEVRALMRKMQAAQVQNADHALEDVDKEEAELREEFARQLAALGEKREGIRRHRDEWLNWDGNLGTVPADTPPGTTTLAWIPGPATAAYKILQNLRGQENPEGPKLQETLERECEIQHGTASAAIAKLIQHEYLSKTEEGLVLTELGRTVTLEG
jgi:hypothetical protein